MATIDFNIDRIDIQNLGVVTTCGMVSNIMHIVCGLVITFMDCAI